VAKLQPERRFTLLYDKVCRQDILQEAWQRVKSNKGAAGVDNVDLNEIREYGEARFLGEIEQELRNGSYRVSLVRRVHIPKTGQPGRTRYADDMVLLARTESEAREAWERLQNQFAALRLVVNQETVLSRTFQVQPSVDGEKTLYSSR
jgi:hypothetical protein